MSTTGSTTMRPVPRKATATETPPSSASISPIDSPRTSPSSTSLSSLASDAELKSKRLVDTYGNEFDLPDFTVNDIRKAIPKRCFERSGLRGLGYVARDLLSLAVVFTLANKFLTPEYVSSAPVRAGLWAGYGFVQGLFATGLWVLAHECGHQSFSPSKILNDTVGWILHSALLVPYFSWKISHGKHHKATAHMERDMVFTPRTKEDQRSRLQHLLHEVDELTEETPLATAFHLLYQQLGGWPAYLFSNVTGHNYHERQTEGRGKGKSNGWFGGVNHFNPASPLFEAKDAKLVALSDLGLFLMGSLLFWVGKHCGWANLVVWYFVPYLWVNHWLVAITYLQHTDPTIPHYTPEAWTYTRGAAATVDREFGFIGRTLMHGIIETHVLHHYVSTIPFYHADEASEAIKKVMGRHYRSDTKDGPLGFLKALWTSSRTCQWVEPNEGATGEAAGVLFFRNSNKIGLAPRR